MNTIDDNKGTINNNNTIIQIYNENDDHQNARVILTNSFQVVCKKKRIKETTMITLWAYQCLVSNNWCPLIFFCGCTPGRGIDSRWRWAVLVWPQRSLAQPREKMGNSRVHRRSRTPKWPQFKRKFLFQSQHIPKSLELPVEHSGWLCGISTQITPNWFTKHDQKTHGSWPVPR